MSQLSALHATTPVSVPRLPPKPLLPSLKIKLTVPQGMLGKRRTSSINLPETTSVAENDGDVFSAPYVPQPSTSQQQLPIQPKRRGRPPKSVVAARQHPVKSTPDAPNHAASALQSHPSQPTKPTKQKKPSARPPAPLKAKPIVKKSSTAAAKRRRVVSSDSSSSSSDLSDVDHLCTFADDDDNQSIQFPTFVSASAMSSRASSSDGDSSDLSSFDDSDSSIEAEEEKFIMSEMQGRARVRRELLGDEAPKKRDPHNAWVIRPRKKSVGPSDVEMDVDTDATEDEDDDDEEAAELDEEETDEKSTGAGYVGVATGWSEDEDESSFDADLFFANLSDSEDRDASRSSDGEGDDGDHSDMESMEASIMSLTSMPPEFEVLEGWDGQIVFTNGLMEGQGMLDMDFEASAASLAETSPSPTQDSDVEMSDVDDGGYEEDADEGDGETTDEELVGEDDLPNERAMRLFNTPFSVSAINPMSTMSPTVSPGPRDRRPYARSIDSPKPADILSGKIFWDSDDHDEYEESTTKSLSQVSSNGQGPRCGQFAPARETRQAIIDDHHKDIPSPHPRFRRRWPSFSHFKSVEHLLQQHLASQQQPTLPCSPSPFHLVTPNADKTITMSPEMANAELVDLNDVLEASFLDPEPPSDSQNTSTDTESRRQLKSFNRWDVISVGAFRQSRETDSGWGSDTTPGNKTDYGSMMKSSPLSTMLWQNKAANHTSQRRSRKMSVVISPVILPVRDRDGDRTPTNPPPQRDQRRDDYNYSHKSRKELRREKKMKRKSYGALHHPNQRHQHHNHHQHHPNLKTRGTSSSQRTNFFSSSVPPLNL
ncbi:hypothetical protein DXG01_005118 [Tephrocybe rancida]|nr:hypothetical protein DXG01_005118 [Tephrocybe rancida]